MGRSREQLRNTIGKLGEQVSKLWARPRTSAPARAEVSAPLDAINDDFHDNYAVSRTQSRQEVPVFVILADDLILFFRGERKAWSFAPTTFHAIKSVVHAPLAIFALFEPRDEGDVDDETESRLGAQKRQLVAALARLEQDAGELEASTRDDLRTVLQACLDFLEPLPRHVSRGALTKFARALGPVLMRLTEDAMQLQVDALHGHTEEALRELSPAAREQLHVVVAGNHQARARSVAIQYFQKRLRETEGVEHRVTYAEGVEDEEGALALVGTTRLDHAIGRAFFDDAHRLQRDILGDAAQKRLAGADLQPIV